MTTTLSLAAPPDLVTPIGVLRTWLECAELDTRAGWSADRAPLGPSAMRSHYDHPAAAVELIMGELSPRIPSHMTISGCLGALWRVRARTQMTNLRFRCEWPDPPAEAEGTPDSGEGLDAFTFRVGGAALSVGTEDGEFLAARAERGERVPARLLGELSYGTVEYTDAGLVVPFSRLSPGEEIEIHFIVAWADGYTEESASTWYAVEQDHDFVVRSLIGA